MNLPYRLRTHAPIRPMWICRTCAGPWPCAVARLLLKAEYCDRRPDLPAFMGTVMQEAISDLDRLTPSGLNLVDVFNRFVAWTKRRPA